MTKTVVGLFDQHTAAVLAVYELDRLGLTAEDISVVSNHGGGEGEGRTFLQHDHGPYPVHDPVRGVASTGVEELLTCMGALVVPGIGPVLAGGWLASILTGTEAGAIIGRFSGGLVGALTKAGVSEDEANVCAECVRRRGTLVAARVDSDRGAEAFAVLQSAGATDIAELGRLYREEGWSRFDLEGRPYL
jgi:hypothetical protein